MNATPDQVEAGHAFYTKRALAVYDGAILGYFSRVAWKCPSGRILQHYNQHVSTNHLDVGVGTGYFLDRCRFESSSPRVALMDPTPTVSKFPAAASIDTTPRCTRPMCWSRSRSTPRSSIPSG